MSTNPMTLVSRRIADPDELGIPKTSTVSVVIDYTFRCPSGCVGTFRMPTAREVLMDSGAMAFIEEQAFEFAGRHVCS